MLDNLSSLFSGGGAAPAEQGSNLLGLASLAGLAGTPWAKSEACSPALPE